MRGSQAINIPWKTLKLHHARQPDAGDGEDEDAHGVRGGGGGKTHVGRMLLSRLGNQHTLESIKIASRRSRLGRSV